MEQARARIAALEGRFGALTAAPVVGAGSFADTLDRARATGSASGASGASGSASGATRATTASTTARFTAGGGVRTIGVAARGAGNVRGLSALAPAAPPPTMPGAPAARPAVPGAAVRGATPLSAPATDASGTDLGVRAVALAKEFLGVPYVWGGEDPSGFDCSGLMQYVYGKLGVRLPRVSRDQARAGTAVASLAQARPGDLVAFGSPVDHIGMYAGDNKMVVAPYTGKNVRIQEITRPITAIRRVT